MSNQQKESQNVEWKRFWHDEYLKWACGFANALGGRLVFGVDDDGNFGWVERRTQVVGGYAEQVEETVGKASGKRRESVGKTAEKVLALCEANPMMTIAEMAKKIDVSERSIERNISNLQEWNLLRRVGGRKEGRWEVIQNESNP